MEVPLKDSYTSNKVVSAIVPAVKTAAGDGNAIDLSGFGSALFAINTGAVAGAGDFGVVMQESDESGSGFANVAAGDQRGTVPATLAASSAYRIGYTGRKRYVRLNVTTAGGTSIALGAVAVLGHPAKAPV
ncbi:MAG: hypothetical protein J0J10_09470 [Bosea sp.]|nr:hypothetical protein [Bosea sp. (in: a-proteobacteria)]